LDATPSGFRELEQVVFFKMREELLKVCGHDFARDGKLLADGIDDLFVRETMFQEFQHAGTDEVQPIHLAVKDVEDDSAVWVMRRAHVFRQFHGKAPAFELQMILNGLSVSELEH
jgi:hypothetical protein